jgi:hypothetical protein
MCALALAACGRHDDESAGQADPSLAYKLEQAAGSDPSLAESNSLPGAPRNRFEGDEDEDESDRPSGPWSAGDERCETPNSSFIDEACYDADEEQLTLVLNGRRYTYCGVDEDLFEELVEAASPGRVYNSEIKGRYRCY